MATITGTQVNASGHDASDLPEVSPEEYNRFLHSARLQAVENLRLDAERLTTENVSRVDISVNPELAVQEDRIFFRYDASVEAFDESSVVAGRFAVVVVVAFEFDGEPPSDHTAERFGLTTGMLVAYPYIREAIQHLGSRVGFPQLVIPLIPLSTTG